MLSDGIFLTVLVRFLTKILIRISENFETQIPSVDTHDVALGWVGRGG